MYKKEQMFERTIVRIPKRAKFKRRGIQDPPRRDAQFKTRIDG